jgi:hypothetical protein
MRGGDKQPAASHNVCMACESAMLDGEITFSFSRNLPPGGRNSHFVTVGFLEAKQL